MNKNPFRPVAVLCSAVNSNYHGLRGVEVYDKRRDMRTFLGGMPIVAHPPCRGWSLRLRHQAKPEPGELELGFRCVKLLERCGGVLEQPARSLLFEACDLPKPGDAGLPHLYSYEVHQSWWGDTRIKRTWLCFFHVPNLPPLKPIQIGVPNNSGKAWRTLTRRNRSDTPLAMAKWLVACARSSQVNSLPLQAESASSNRVNPLQIRNPAAQTDKHRSTKP